MDYLKMFFEFCVDNFPTIVNFISVVCSICSIIQSYKNEGRMDNKIK